MTVVKHSETLLRVSCLVIPIVFLHVSNSPSKLLHSMMGDDRLDLKLLPTPPPVRAIPASQSVHLSKELTVLKWNGLKSSHARPVSPTTASSQPVFCFFFAFMAGALFSSQHFLSIPCM
eukprot:GILJ01014933.1.p1 GENE.GILJ01014933.1~~GILJ01014933.1.p1  ORF type:complete len:119 (+),score=13.90 GILJ01014933.1:85-441(+)